MKRAAWLAALALGVLAPGTAAGNGRFPATIDVHFQPGDRDVIALQATWGLITTRDGGATWHWSCEEAVGFGGVYDPDYAFTPSGLLLATTTVAGLRQTRDMCTWSPTPAPLGEATFVARLAVGPEGAIYAMASTGTDSQLYVSTDDAASFSARSDPPPGGVDWWQSFMAAPTRLTTPGMPTRLYLTGYDLDGSGKTRYLLRSDDSGATWTSLPITGFTFGGDSADLEIAAVSPTDPDLVFARVYGANGTTIGDDIYRSSNAGATWTRVFQIGDNVTAVVVRRSGQVVIGTSLSGIYVSNDGGGTFGASVVDDQPVNCMKERGEDQLLFACGDALIPTYMGIGTATDPASWTSMMDYRDIDDAYACPAGTDQQDTCNALRWCGTACQFGIPDPACQPCSDTPDAGAGDEPMPPDKKCTDCSGGRPASAALLAIVLALALARRRRRRNA